MIFLFLIFNKSDKSDMTTKATFNVAFVFTS